VKSFLKLLVLLSTLGTDARILIGTGVTFGTQPINPVLTEFVGRAKSKDERFTILLYLLLESAFDFAFRTEHEITENIHHGFNFCFKVGAPYITFTPGYLIGGKIAKSSKYTHYLNGTLNLVIKIDMEQNWAIGFSPSIEYAWKRDDSKIMHSIGLACIFWNKHTLSGIAKDYQMILLTNPFSILARYNIKWIVA